MDNQTSSVSKTKNVVKIEYEGEIRKYRHIETYNNLIVAIAKTIGFGVINCRFTYVDDDGDKITVSNDDDLQEAINFFGTKIPKLTLVTYSEEVDASISHLRLCDSGTSAEDNKLDDCQNEEFDEKVPEKSINLPLQFEKEDRPLQMEISDQKSQPEPPSLEASQEKIENEYQPVNNDSNIMFQSIEPDFGEYNNDDKEEPIDSSKENSFVEDRPLKVEEEEKEVVLEQSQEKAPELKIEAKLDLDSLKSKIQEIVKLEAQQLIPELLSQYKPKESKNDVIHYISCDMCKSKSMVGFRYKCSICPNYDLCSECESKNVHKHPFLKIKSPEMYQSFLKHLCRPEIN